MRTPFFESISTTRKVLFILACGIGLVQGGIFLLSPEGEYHILPYAFWPLPYALVLQVVLSFLSADIFVELFRALSPSTKSWPDKKHFLTVLAVWVVLFGLHTNLLLQVRQSGVLGA